MTKEIRNPKAEGDGRRALGSGFGLLSDFVIRISSFSSASGARGWQPSPEASGAWMKFAVNFAQALSGHVRVNLRRRDARVTEQFLNHAQVRAMIE